MDLGDLVFFVIFIIIVVSNIVKQVKKQKKATGALPAETKTGWKKTMEDILKDIRTQIEQGAEPPSGEPSRRPSGWEDLILAETKEKQIPQKESQQQPAVKMRQKTIPEASRRESDFDELRGQGPEADSRESENKRVKEKKFPRGMRRTLSEKPVATRMSGAKLTVEDLKNAVIWHEILSPPLGLRNF
jgi:hypothetical protein